MSRGLRWLAGLAAALALASAPATGGAAPQVVTGTPLAAAGAAVIDLGAVAAAHRPAGPGPRGPTVAPEPRPGPLGRSVPPDALPPAGSGAPAPSEPRTPSPSLPSPVPVAAFLALDDDDTAIPPDTHGAVGPGHLVVALNRGVRVQTRTGTPLLTVPLATFWAALGPFANGPFDPRVLYDPLGGRWIMSATADTTLPGASLLVGASQTGDPTGLWNLYRFDADPANVLWPDFPALGFNASWIVVTANMYDNADNFVEPDVYVFPKASVYAGAPVTSTRFAAVSGAGVGFSLAPAATRDASADMPLVENWNGSFLGQGFLRFSRLTGPAGAPVLSLDVAFPSAPDPWASSVPGGADFAPQLFSPHKVQVNDARIGANCVRRASSVWCAQEVFLPVSAPARVAVQWWQLDAATGAVVQVGRVDDPSGQRSFIYPSIAANAAGDVLVGYSRLSATQFASGNYAFRAAGDPPNTLRADTVLKEGEAPYVKTFSGTKNRWGDYSATVVDPVDDTSFWTIQEYAATPQGGSDRWGTWWGRISPGGPGGSSGAVCEIRLPQTVYTNGQVLSPTLVRLANPTAGALGVETKAWLQFAGQGPRGLANVGPDGSFVLAPGFDQNFAAPLLTISAADPRGPATFGCRVFDPVTGALVAESQAGFLVQ